MSQVANSLDWNFRQLLLLTLLVLQFYELHLKL